MTRKTNQLTNELAGQVWCRPENSDTTLDYDLALGFSVTLHEKCFNVVRSRMEQDSDLAYGWHCNIAVPMQDEGVDHTTANKAAVRIMKALFDIDTEPMVREFLPTVFKDRLKDDN